MPEKRDKKGLTESEFLQTYQAKNYPKPALTADIVLFGTESDPSDQTLSVLLIRRGGHPFLDCWAFPGGFANQNEPIEETARREFLEETGLQNIPMRPVGLFSRPGRDPRGWVVSQAFFAQVDRDSCKPIAGDDAAQTAWFRISYSDGDDNGGGLFILSHEQMEIQFRAQSNGESWTISDLSEERLAFDHAEILASAFRLLQAK